MVTGAKIEEGPKQPHIHRASRRKIFFLMPFVGIAVLYFDYMYVGLLNAFYMFLGPIWIMERSRPNFHIDLACITAILLVCIALPLVKPHWATLVLSVGACVFWIFLGYLGWIMGA